MPDLTPELIEAGVRALYGPPPTDRGGVPHATVRGMYREQARAVLIAVVPLIEAAAVERERERIAVLLQHQLEAQQTDPEAVDFNAGFDACLKAAVEIVREPGVGS